MLVLKSIIQGSGEFQKLLVNPVISRDKAEKAVGKVLAAANACDLTKKFFALLARNRRLSVASLAIEAYLARLAQDRGELTVQVTTASALSADELQTLNGTIAKATGKKVEIQSRENPALIGGLQVKIGSKMLDNSVAGKLDRLKQSLTDAA
jgi:F-type H+-transporting ATPase subunit delta